MHYEKIDIMIIQLTSGKIIQISVEQYLDLTDEELDFLNNPGNNIGDYPKSLWLNSPISNKNTKSHTSSNEIDYVEENEEVFYEEPFTTETPLINEIQDDLEDDSENE